MRCSQQNDRQVHAEVEHLEDLRLGQAQDQDPAKLGQCDAAEHRAAHVSQCILCPLHPRALCADRECPHNVAAELH